MNIQQNLNALLTMGAVAARTSDKYKTNKEYEHLTKTEAAQEKVHQALRNRNDQIMGEGKMDDIVQQKEQESLGKIADINIAKASLKGKEEDINKAVDVEIQKQTEQRGYEETLEAMAQDEENELGLKVKAANERLLAEQKQFQENARAQRQVDEERRQILKQNEMRDVLAAARKTYGGK